MHGDLEKKIKDLYDPLARRHAVLRDELLASLPTAKAKHASPERKMTMSIVKITGLIGAAAAVAIAALLTLMSPGLPYASAAECLARSVEATEGYHGWVTITSRVLDGKRDYTIVNVINTETESWFSLRDGGDVWYSCPAQGVHMKYSAAANTIDPEWVGDENGMKGIDVMKLYLMPDLLAEALKEQAGLEVSQQWRGGLVEMAFDLTQRKNGPRCVLKRMVLLVDPQTSLIQSLRVMLDDEDGEGFLDLDYGETPYSDVTDIYGLGVPRDAKILTASPASGPQE